MSHQVPYAYHEMFTNTDWRYAVYWGGRGSGKSVAATDYCLRRAEEEPVRVLCTRYKQNSLKESVHALMVSRIEALGLEGFEITNSEIRHRNGARFIFQGLWGNIDSIKSMADIDICWVEEANILPDDTWAKLIPTIRAPGSKIIATFNPELKTDAVYQRFVLNPPKNSIVRKTSWRDNPWFTQELIDEKDHDFHVDEAKAKHIWEGEFLQYADGAVYADQLKKAHTEGRVCSVPYQPSAEVHTFWDLGRNDSTAIWFMQQIGKEHHFIDYYEASMADLDHYIRVLKDKPYNYGRHYLPHDVVVTELSSNRGSRKDILESGGIRPITVVTRIPNINEGLEKTRAAFYQCWFDAERCERGLDALANYKYKFNEEANTYGLQPLHNWASNGADAFRQYAQGYKDRRDIDFSMYQPNQRLFE